MSRTVPADAMLLPETATRAFKGTMFDVYQWPQKLYDGSTATYEMLKRPDTIQVLAVQDGKLVLLDEQQSGRPAYLRFPGGRVESGETWLAAAQRECKEELGMEFGSWRLVQVRQPIVKIEWFVATFVATDLTKTGELHLDAGERNTVLELTFDEFKHRLQTEDNPLIDYARLLFDKLGSLDDLLAMPKFQGKEIKDYQK